MWDDAPMAVVSRKRCFAVLAMLASGCANPGTGIKPNVALLTQPQPYIYSDQDWAAVLQDDVKDGLVDYENLAQHHEALDRYYALLGVTGPKTTADQFADRPQTAAYWINAYNALVYAKS